MASEKAKELAAKQKAAIKAEKLRKKNSDDPRDWGRVRQLREAYNRTYEVDKQLPLWMFGLGLLAALAIALLGYFSNMHVALWLPLAILSGIMVAMIVLSRRVQKGMVTRYEGQPGSAEVAFQLLNNRKYSYQMAVTATRDLDLVHRVVGPSGVVLVGEGNAGRVKQLLTREARKHETVSYGTPVHTIVLGNGGGQVKLGDLKTHIEKLPNALEKHQVNELLQRLRALDAVRPKAPVPKGPMPTPKGINRAMRGR